MTTSIHEYTTARCSNKSKTAVATAVAPDRFFDDVVGSNAQLVVAEMARCFATRAMRHFVLSFLYAQCKVGYLNVCFVVAPAVGWVPVLMHPLVDETMQALIFLAVGLPYGRTLAAFEEFLGFVQGNPQDRGDVVLTAFDTRLRFCHPALNKAMSYAS